MQHSASRMVFVSISDVANGAENVLLMLAEASKSRIIFLKKSNKHGLQIPKRIAHSYASDKSIILGLLKLIILLFPYRQGCTIMSTHPYLNAYLGILKRIGYLKSSLVVRECSSVLTRYSGLKKLSYKLAYRMGYPGANLVVCQTGLMKEQFLSHISFIPPNKVIVLNNPIDGEAIIKKSQKYLAKGYRNAQFICAAGRLIPEKGFDVLIKAIKCIECQFPELKLLVFGDGPQKAVLNQMINDYGLTDKVILKGWIKNPVPYFKNAKVCVVSSIKEGFPNVLLEMLSVNPRLVSTLCAGGIEAIPEIFTAKVNDVDDLAIAIKKALNSEQEAHKIKHNNYLLNRTPAVYIDAATNSL